MSSKAEVNRSIVLREYERDDKISHLVLQPVFPLYTSSGKCIATYTADFAYYDKVTKELVVEEFKGSKGQWAYKRRDYSIFRRWVMADYPEFSFVEIFMNGDSNRPKLRKKKDHQKHKEGMKQYLELISSAYPMQ